MELLPDSIPEEPIEILPEGWHRHSFGGGLVQDTAYVSPSVYVGKDAIVQGNAHLRGKVNVFDKAKIGGYACIMDHAAVYGRAKIGGYAVVGGNTSVFGDQVIDEPVRLFDVELS